MHTSYITLSELPAIVPLVNAAYRGEASKAGWTTEANIVGGDKRTDLAQLQTLHADKNTVFIKVTNEQDAIVGSVYLCKHANDGLYLGMLSVWPTLQAKGIGKLLMLAAEKHAKTVDCQRIFMNVISIRTELIEWYKRLGYKITDERKEFASINPEYGYALQPLEFLVMEKRI